MIYFDVATDILNRWNSFFKNSKYVFVVMYLVIKTVREQISLKHACRKVDEFQCSIQQYQELLIHHC